MCKFCDTLPFFPSVRDSWNKERSEKDELLKNTKAQNLQQQARAQDAEVIFFRFLQGMKMLRKSWLPVLYRRLEDLLPLSVEPASRHSCLVFALHSLSEHSKKSYGNPGLGSYADPLHPYIGIHILHTVHLSFLWY